MQDSMFLTTIFFFLVLMDFCPFFMINLGNRSLVPACHSERAQSRESQWPSAKELVHPLLLVLVLRADSALSVIKSEAESQEMRTRLIATGR